MNMYAHTPGPWEARRDPSHFDTLSSVVGGEYDATRTFVRHELVVEVGGFGPPLTQEANARLISAAPDLLEALEPFAAFAEAVVRFAEGSGNFPKTGELYCLHGHGLEERTLTVEHFRAALKVISKTKEESE